MLMGPGYFVIAILGCADGGRACTPVATLDTRYETADQCSAATGAALLEHNDFDFPSLVARCRSAKPAEAAENARAKPLREHARRS
jgi:acyl-CoA synthetase (AMP-forming)/AMP-acid ligase II